MAVLTYTTITQEKEQGQTYFKINGLMDELDPSFNYDRKIGITFWLNGVDIVTCYTYSTNEHDTIITISDSSAYDSDGNIFQPDEYFQSGYEYNCIADIYYYNAEEEEYLPAGATYPFSLTYEGGSPLYMYINGQGYMPGTLYQCNSVGQYVPVNPHMYIQGEYK